MTKYIGMRFGKLTAIEDQPMYILNRPHRVYKRHRLLFRCDCGEVVSRLLDSVRGSPTKCCLPCARKEKYSKVKELDMEKYSGIRYGKVITIKRVDDLIFKSENTLRKRVTYLCKCDCGEYCERRIDDLKRGKTTSCNKCVKLGRKPKGEKNESRVTSSTFTNSSQGEQSTY